MSRTRPGALTGIWRNFIKSFGAARSRNEQTIVGKDKYGNVFFEKGDNVTDAKRGYRAPPELGESEVMHPLWADWLRGRLDAPPSTEQQNDMDLQHTNKQHAVQQQAINTNTNYTKTASKSPSASAYPHVQSDESQIEDGKIYPKYSEYFDIPDPHKKHSKS